MAERVWKKIEVVPTRDRLYSERGGYFDIIFWRNTTQSSVVTVTEPELRVLHGILQSMVG